MEIKNLKLAELRLNPTNPREVVEEKYKQLIDSILVFPKMMELRPVVYNARREVLGGNMRLRALQDIAQMSLEDIKARLECLEGYRSKPQAERVALLELWQRWLDSPYAPAASAEGLTDAEQQEFIIKDNLSFGKWDWDALADDWDETQLEEWGLDVWQLEDEEEAPETKEDDFDEEQDEIHIRCKKGDIWQLGEHRLMCGDTTDLETVKTLMGGGVLADMVFTDPPYGVAIGDKNKLLNATTSVERIEENIANDTLPVEELYKVLQKAMTNLRLNCKDDAVYFVTAPQGGGLCEMMMMMMKDSGLQVRHNLIWNKNSPTFSLGRLDYDYKHEPIFYTWTKSHHNYRKGAFRSSVWDIDRPRESKLHPTMKPVELVANCMLDGTKEGDIVLDGFGGSGTTIIAAEQLNRKAYVMELDPHYCDVIIARWEKMTGKTAIKIN